MDVSISKRDRLSPSVKSCQNSSITFLALKNLVPFLAKVVKKKREKKKWIEFRARLPTCVSGATQHESSSERQQEPLLFGKPAPPKVDFEDQCPPRVNCDACPNLKCAYPDIVRPLVGANSTGLPPRSVGTCFTHANMLLCSLFLILSQIQLVPFLPFSLSCYCFPFFVSLIS